MRMNLKSGAKGCLPWVTLAVLFGLVGSCQRSKVPPYMKSEPLSQPIVLDSTLTTVNGIAFSEDGHSLFLSKQTPETFDNERSFAGIFISTYQDSVWSDPEQLTFEIPLDAYHPVFSPDFHQLLFNSRSHPDSGRMYLKHDIWMVERADEGWGMPYPVAAVNSDAYDSYPSIAADNSIYFNSDRPGGKGGMDVYVSRYVENAYQEPENLWAVNSPQEENDLVVDPLERFIIFNRYDPESRILDLYISFNEEGIWSLPRAIDNINEKDKMELTPSLSPEGKYFFYERDGLIMQTELSQIIFEDEIPDLGERTRTP